MIAKNNSYFDKELCLDGHYIITGYTNDQFCNTVLQLSDIRFELHHYLRYSQGFEAVVFFDGVDMLYCYDQESFDILQGVSNRETASSQVSGRSNEEIVRTTPLGTRRRRRGTDIQRTENDRNTANQARNRFGQWNMGRTSYRVSWDQVIHLLRFYDHRIALVLSNMDSLITSMDVQEMAVLEQLQSYHSRNHSIVIYIFRETSITSLVESVNQSVAGASNQWARFVRNVLISRIDTKLPEGNRVISLRTPNPLEVSNLLNHMRFGTDIKLNIAAGDMGTIAAELAASCGRQSWGLVNLLARLERCISEDPEKQLTAQNWREFTGEENYLSPMDRLNSLIGMEDIRDDKGNLKREGVKTYIRQWYALQRNRGFQNKYSNYSRFTPVPNPNALRGHQLNIRIKGNPGTGKTTIARLFAELYYDLGLLSQGHTIECAASDLVSQNVGGTAGLVRSRVQEAMGGVLFIDEAYSLYTNQHGIEAINQLVNDMSAYEGQFAVIIAGYSANIDRLMRENDGLARRFPNELVLEDYTAEEMQQIFEKMVNDDRENVVIGSDLQEILPVFCESWVGGKTRGWGNAGEAEKLLAAMKKRCSVRMDREGIGPGTFELSPADIPESLQHCLKRRSQDLREAFQEIDELIGLTNVKRFLKQLSRDILWGAEERAPGNYIFSGPPGTGKTTVARKMGEILGHLKVLRRKTNNVIECKAADLLSGSVELSEIVEDARGGVLFIDEAHQLEQNERGHAIIRALVPLIEDPEIHADTCFICAGYTVEMKRFLAVDSGLSRRFPITHRIRFDDYTAAELVRILEKMAQERGERTDCDEFLAYKNRSRAALEKYLEHKPLNFGNGGFIRDVYLPESISARTARLNRKYNGDENTIIDESIVKNIDPDERRTLTEEDIPKSFRQLAGPVGRRIKEERNAKVMLSELYGKEEFVEYVQALYAPDDRNDFYDTNTEVGMHYSVTGPEGSGRRLAIKTMAKARKELGFLEKDDVAFVGKADLEAGYVGQTAIKTQNVVEQAIGGTLVVTYPSTMLPKNANDNTFGPEALGVIFSAMSEHFNDLCVVFMDTADGMEEFMKAFPSVRSHLSRQFVFEDITPDDMYKIFTLKTADGMEFEDELNTLMPDVFLNWVSDRGGLGDAVTSWGNGKEADQLIDELIQNWKRENGDTVKREITENGSSYTLNKRLITAAMFPRKMGKYMVSNRTVSENAMRELEALTGLRSVKNSIHVIERRMRMMPTGTVNPGLYCYIGNPGVGKTTVARLMGGILKAAGALSQGHVIVRTARQMCDAVGQFDKIIKLARNGILFIDEAHQLAESSFGVMVIKKLLTVIEDADVIKNTCIILAGYPAEMARLLDQDSGLASRFGLSNSIIRFEDYTGDELVQILEYMAARADTIVQIGTPFPLRLSDEYKTRSYRVFKSVISEGNPDFGNARFVRNYLHDSVDELLERLELEYGADGNISDDEKDYLTENDIPKKYRTLEGLKRRKAIIPAADILTDAAGAITDNNLYEKFNEYSQNIVLLESFKGDVKKGEGTGSIITKEGHVLTCAHVVRDADRIRARIYCPGMPGGDYRWIDCTILDGVFNDCDMAVIQMNGNNFNPISMRPSDEIINAGEQTFLIGFPLGAMLAGNNIDALKASHFSGQIASAQTINDVERYYVDITGLHGNSGSPVISKTDGRMIGVFSGSVAPRHKGNLDELNYFYPIKYFWEKFAVKNNQGIRKETTTDIRGVQ